MSTLGSRSVARNGKALSPAFLKRRWKPGQSGNPSGHTAEYGEVVALARSLSPRAIERLGQLMESEDERVAAVACNAILDRAFGRPQQQRAEEEDSLVARLERMTDEQRAAHAQELRGKVMAVLARARGEPELIECEADVAQDETAV
jgi:hypothetical protein